MPELQQPTYKELLAQLAEYVSLFDAMRAHQADALIGADQLAFIRPHDIEVALRSSEEKFRTLFHSGHFAIELANVPDGSIVEVNEAWGKLLGRKVGSVNGRSWQELGIWSDEETAANYKTKLRAGDPVVDRELVLLNGDGELVQVLANTDKVMLKGQEYWLTTLQDISERKAAEAGLLEADRRKDQFLATLAHELRSPLAPLSNALQILEDGPHDPQVVSQMYQLMRRQLQQLVTLVDDLLDLSRVNRGVVVLREAPVRVADALAQAIEANRPTLREKKHDLRMVAFNEEAWTYGDRTRLVQIFTNLLNNAIKYTDPTGSITVKCNCNDREVMVSICDTGIGIEPQQLARVFDVFAQVEPSSTRTHGGLGIGLSIVKQLVEMHGGSIEAHSQGKDKGSTFQVTLPRIRATQLVGSYGRDSGIKGDQ
jgi:PAS domain S-box-containing protein